MTDLQALGLFAGLLLASVGVGEGLRRAGWRAEASRRVVHVGVGLTVAACPTWFSRPEPIYALAGVFLVGNAVALGQGWFRGMHGIVRRSWGTVVFPLALILALALCWGPFGERVWAMQVAFAVLALADPVASWVGSRAARRRQADEAKSWAGSLAFAAVAFSVALAMGWNTVHTWDSVLTAALTVTFLATVAEALGRRGWDNLWVVLAVIVAWVWWGGPSAGTVIGLGAIGTALAFAWPTWRVGVLSGTGALAGSLLAWGLVVEWRMGWWAPALAFFVLSSAWSLVGRRRKRDAQARTQKGSRRDAAQVVANGGVGLALLALTLFGYVEWMLWAFVASFAAAAADTWGTEIGTWRRGRTRWLGVGREVPPGTSGGMSRAGTAGAVAGALSVVIAAWLTQGWPFGGAVVPLTLVAVAAALLDSLLGATLQARYGLPDGASTERSEHDGRALPLVRGVRWIDNDAVNWACTLAGGLGGAVAWHVLA